MAHIFREHPAVDAVPKMNDRELWRYLRAEMDFLSTPEQKRVPVAVSAAVDELERRWFNKRRRRT